jgi:hypothetical protein
MQMLRHRYRARCWLMTVGVLALIHTPSSGAAMPRLLQGGGPSVCNMSLYYIGEELQYWCSGDTTCDVPTICIAYGMQTPSGEATFCRCQSGPISKCNTVVTEDDGEFEINCMNPCSSGCDVMDPGDITTQPQVPCSCR